MLAEIQELQNDAVSQLIATLKSTPKDSYTFRAPTGSGKTYMMADFMNRMIEINPDIVFLVMLLITANGGLYPNTHRILQKKVDNICVIILKVWF